MFNTPRFNSSYRIETAEPDSVFFLTERNYLLFNDPIIQKLASFIDGHHTVEEIIDQFLADAITQTDSIEDAFSLLQNSVDNGLKVQYALAQMSQQRHIVNIEDEQEIPNNLTLFCEHLKIAPRVAYQRLQTTKVAVTSFGSNLPTTELKAALESMHIQISDNSDTADITVILTDDYLHNQLKTFNQKAIENERPWILIKPIGTIVWIGPIFIPAKTGCWDCLAQRLHYNRPVTSYIQRKNNISTPLTPPLDYLPSTLQTAIGIAATEIWKWIIQGKHQLLEGNIITHDTLSLQIQNHILVKRPQCPSCGIIASGFQEQPLPIVLGSRKKTSTTDGGHRHISPAETLRKYQHHISPITGVIRELGKVYSGVDNLTHAYVAKHHFATVFDDFNTLEQNLRGRSAGKGKTDLQAQVSSICEAIERYSGVFQGDEIREKGSFQQMGERAIHPNTCMNFSQSQYQTREQWNSSNSSWFQKVPEPFDEEREIEWTPVWSLTNQEFKYLPTGYCYFGYPQQFQPDCWADSNGCASGNTIEEAILQGFMELVERDSVALWWYNRVKRPRVDLDSFDDPYFLTLKDYYHKIKREIWVIDITSDLNIPTFAAISRRIDQQPEDIIFGYGTHFDPQIAISRALTEVNQLLPSVLSANSDGSTKYPASADPLALDWWKTATIANQPYLTPDKNAATKVSTDYPQIWSDDLLDDVILCQQIVEKNGMEMLVLDQTRRDVGLRVVKVIVPGMRHWWKRLNSGRLYDVPVKLNWLPQPLSEHQLNPLPMWM
ncbi:MAG TPA: TOMM precursor leader peptide-binding protein [Nostocaceae cyanobacterium]|nr:TOMM precursor leader peptide-binding protein [Nostocaceae cyanobacterium]